MRLVAISDTHGRHRQLVMPEGDVVIHCGDFCARGKEREARDFAAWFRALPHVHKVVIAGNHDLCLERDPSRAAELFDGCPYLFDRAATVAGPTTPSAVRPSESWKAVTAATRASS